MGHCHPSLALLGCLGRGIKGFGRGIKGKSLGFLFFFCVCVSVCFLSLVFLQLVMTRMTRLLPQLDCFVSDLLFHAS
jgi:hypothetical protein